MKKPSFIEVCIIWPFRDLLFSMRLRNMNKLLVLHDMDWGKYPLEEIYKMYLKHKDEINLI